MGGAVDTATNVLGCFVWLGKCALGTVLEQIAVSAGAEE